MASSSQQDAQSVTLTPQKEGVGAGRTSDPQFWELYDQLMADLDAAKEDAAAERLRKFDAEHGSEPVIIGNWRLYEDGARCHLLTNELIDPPTQERFKYHLRKRYYWERTAVLHRNLKRFILGLKDGTLKQLSGDEIFIRGARLLDASRACQDLICFEQIETQENQRHWMKLFMLNSCDETRRPGKRNPANSLNRTTSYEFPLPKVDVE